MEVVIKKEKCLLGQKERCNLKLLGSVDQQLVPASLAEEPGEGLASDQVGAEHRLGKARDMIVKTR